VLPRTRIEAYAWLSLASMQGDRDAETLRFVVMGRLDVAECHARGGGGRRAARYEAEIRGNVPSH
jgi:hypothetical protein